MTISQYSDGLSDYYTAISLRRAARVQRRAGLGSFNYRSAVISKYQYKMSVLIHAYGIRLDASHSLHFTLFQ